LENKITPKQKYVLLLAIDLAVQEYQASDETKKFESDIKILNRLSQKIRKGK
jgi:hypothetical protein